MNVHITKQKYRIIWIDLIEFFLAHFNLLKCKFVNIFQISDSISHELPSILQLTPTKRNSSAVEIKTNNNGTFRRNVLIKIRFKLYFSHLDIWNARF
jgi:hypothetical protein